MRYRTNILVVLLMVSTLVYPPIVYIAHRPPQTSPPEYLKVMTFNIHQFFVEDYVSISEKTGELNFNNLLQTIYEINPDIIGLQESEGGRLTHGNLNGVHWLATKLKMYYFFGPETSDQIYGVSLLSKFPISSAEVIPLPNQESIERVLVRATLAIGTKNVQVMITHLQTSSYKLDQRLQVQKIISEIGTTPTLLLGDFNTRSDLNDEAYTMLNARYDDAFEMAGNNPNSSLGFSSPAGNPSHRVDYIWLTRGHWLVKSDSVKTAGNEFVSDHLAVYGLIKINF